MHTAVQLACAALILCGVWLLWGPAIVLLVAGVGGLAASAAIEVATNRAKANTTGSNTTTDGE